MSVAPETLSCREIGIMDLGLVGYEEALNSQMRLLDRRISGEVGDTLIMLEHDSVLTMGRIPDWESVVDGDYFKDRGIPVISAARGGKVTYHSPGQLVLYPIIDLSDKKKDVSFYIDFLEKTVKDALLFLGVPAGRSSGKRGVWAAGKKIAFTGVGIRKWVTFHGVSININNDTEAFTKIIPCGESDIKVISAREILGRELDMRDVKKAMAVSFKRNLINEYGVDPE